MRNRCSAALLAAHPGVVGHRIETGSLQFAGQLIHPAAGAGVHDARLAAVIRQEGLQLTAGLILGPQQIPDVRPVEAGQEHLAFLQPQPLHNLGAGARVGGGGERQARHRRKAIGQQPELDVLGSEVVPPLRDAVGLIDGEQRQGFRSRQGRQLLQQVSGQQPFRRHVEQVQPALLQAALHGRGLRPLQAGVQCSRRHAQLLERRHLVLHQGDQGRHHHRQPRPAQGGHLIAQRFAAAGGHQHQARAAGDHVAHDRVLGTAEGGVTPHLLQHLKGVAG